MACFAAIREISCAGETSRIKGEFYTPATALNDPCGGLLDDLLRVDQIDDQPALVADCGAQGRQAAVADDFATSNHHDTLTQGLNIVHIVRRENHRHPIVAIEHFDKSRTASFETASRPIVGSSRNSRRGPCNNAAARSLRMRCPRES